MSDFDEDWLALREPADREARNQDVLKALAQHFSDHTTINILDLGCGTGSTLRAIAPHLPARQSWVLLDHSRPLLEAAQSVLVDWADDETRLYASDDLSQLRLHRQGRQILVSFMVHDLATDPLPASRQGADLVTTSAFFDLTSKVFAQSFVARLAAEELPLYAALEVDGRDQWRPPHPVDKDMEAAFRFDQKRDKGFGSALGPDAPSTLADALKSHGYKITMGPSDWQVGSFGRERRNPALCAELADGWARVAETNRMVAHQALQRWREARLSDQTSCTISHQDLLALPRD